MNQQSRRVGLILLIGVVAVAATLILRSNDKSSNDSDARQAAVFAADQSGAITQTDDGVTRGYNRDGEVLWTQPQMLGAGAEGEQRARITNFFCAGKCPDAYGNSALAGKNQLLKYGFGESGAGATLGSPLNADDIVLRGVPDATSLFIRRPASGKKSEFVFVTAPQAGSGSIDLSEPVTMDNTAVATPLTSGDQKRVVAVEHSKSGSGQLTTLRWFTRNGNKWNASGKPVTVKDANACFDGTGDRVALGGPKTLLMQFGGLGQRPLPISGKLMGCTFSSDGVTFSYSKSDDKTALLVVHFNNAGAKVWSRNFTNAGSFNLSQGQSDLFQLTTREGTQLLNAKNGATLENNQGETAAFPIGNNVFVTADGKGKPTWIDR